MIELYKHNEEAYKNLKTMLETENRACIIHPTGTGKSYIALKWILDNKEKKSVYVTSQLPIKEQFERTIRENGLDLERDLPNLEIITYKKLLKNSEIDADMIVLDEFHRAGASKWGKAVKNFLERNKTSKVLGITATPIRYLDRKRDMSDEIFHGNIASHITLAKAIAEGILPPPIYINAIFSFKEDIERLEQKIAPVPDEEERKELEEKLNLAKRTIEKSESLNNIFKKYMTKENGKYLVFCRDIEHLTEMKKQAQEMFGKINKNIDTYYMHSLEDEEHNKYTLDRFHYVRDDNLKLLYSVGMLNEGVHVEDIDGVIMFRPTSSPILYQQQLGRALTTGKKHEPLVFDIVNNIECLKDIEMLRDSVLSTMEKSGKSKKEIEKMKESFLVIDNYKNISDLIRELDENTKYNTPLFYQDVNKFYERIKKEDKNAMKEFCIFYMPRIQKLAKKYENSEISYDDMVSEGILALYEAVEKYDSTNKLSFPAYLYRKIYRKMKFTAIESIKEAEGFREMEEEDFDSNYSEYTNYNQTEKDAITNIMIKDLLEFLASGIITELEYKVLNLRFGLEDGEDKSLEEVGQIFGVTRERIKHIERKTLKKLSRRSNQFYKKFYNYLDEDSFKIK